MPISLSMIAIEVGRRAGVPILGIGTPGHFVVRDARSDVYADPFGGGVIYDRDGIVDLCRRRTGAPTIPSSALAPVSARQIMVRVVNNLTASLTRTPSRHVADPQIFHLVGIRQGLAEFAEESHQWPALLRHWN
jgi:regulator of sirC expression with transglutaminase-like and TPR domain